MCALKLAQPDALKEYTSPPHPKITENPEPHGSAVHPENGRLRRIGRHSTRGTMTCSPGTRQIGEASTQVSKFRLRLSLKSGYTAVAPMEVVEAQPLYPRRGDHHHDCHRHHPRCFQYRLLCLL